MTHYIIGYTSNEFLIGNFLVPKKVYTEEEKARGKKNFTAVSEEDLKQLRTNKVFNALEAGKKLRVLDKLPGWAVSGGERESALQAKNKELEAALQASEAEKGNITKEAQDIIDDLRKQLEAATKKE